VKEKTKKEAAADAGEVKERQQRERAEEDRNRGIKRELFRGKDSRDERRTGKVGREGREKNRQRKVT